MNNPWQFIELEKYERHMASDEVYQLQRLNAITKEQLEDNQHTYVAILGAAGGNGLEHIDTSKTKKVYAVDINKNYLDACLQRYGHMKNILEILCMDLNSDSVILPCTDLIICNLIIEYLGEEVFISIIDKNKANMDTVSCVIQKNADSSFISKSELALHFKPILSIHHDIDENKLKKLFSNIGFDCIKYKAYELPNCKIFIRMDFKR